MAWFDSKSIYCMCRTDPLQIQNIIQLKHLESCGYRCFPSTRTELYVFFKEQHFSRRCAKNKKCIAQFKNSTFKKKDTM